MVRCRCPYCGEVDLKPKDIVLRCSPTWPSTSYFGFHCPVCGLWSSYHATDEIARRLVAVGVIARLLEMPPELLEVHDGPRLTLDDLIDLHYDIEELESDDDSGHPFREGLRPDRPPR